MWPFARQPRTETKGLAQSTDDLYALVGPVSSTTSAVPVMAECALKVPALGSAMRVRDFLDSREGRQFADAVADELARGASLTDAIEAAVARWMD